jgi:hypothetical protein
LLRWRRNWRSLPGRTTITVMEMEDQLADFLAALRAAAGTLTLPQRHDRKEHR